MIIHALHKNGYLYKYDTNLLEDIDIWFEGRSAEDIEAAFKMGDTYSPSDYVAEGMKVDLKYVDGLMDGARDTLDNLDII